MVMQCLYHTITGSGCQLETDTEWEIQWPYTASGSLATQTCPGLSESKGELYHIDLCTYILS